MAHDRHGLLVGEEVSDDSHQIRVIADVLRGPAPREKQSIVIVGIDIPKRDCGFEVVAWLFSGNVPSGRDLVHYQGIDASIRPSDNRLVAVLLDAVDRIERIHRLRSVTDRD